MRFVPRTRRGKAAVAFVALAGLVAVAPEAEPSAPLAASPTGPPVVTTSPATTTVAPSAAPTVSTAAEALDRLAVRAPTERVGYSRAMFGSYRAAVDQVRARDIGGRASFTDPYTGSATTAKGAEADHVVSLADAWDSGASRWEPARRDELARDPLNLLMTAGPVNGSKSDQTAATWLPFGGYRCGFVARQITVKHRYRLSVTVPEASAMRRVLASCPGEPLTPATVAHGRVVAAPAPSKAPNPAPKVTRAPKPRAATHEPAPAPRAVSYANCAEARAAGAAPIHRGEPGYTRKLDRDGDGIACE